MTTIKFDTRSLVISVLALAVAGLAVTIFLQMRSIGNLRGEAERQHREHLMVVAEFQTNAVVEKERHRAECEDLRLQVESVARDERSALEAAGAERRKVNEQEILIGSLREQLAAANGRISEANKAPQEEVVAAVPTPPTDRAAQASDKLAAQLTSLAQREEGRKSEYLKCASALNRSVGARHEILASQMSGKQRMIERDPKTVVESPKEAFDQVARLEVLIATQRTSLAASEKLWQETVAEWGLVVQANFSGVTVGQRGSYDETRKNMAREVALQAGRTAQQEANEAKLLGALDTVRVARVVDKAGEDPRKGYIVCVAKTPLEGEVLWIMVEKKGLYKSGGQLKTIATKYVRVLSQPVDKSGQLIVEVLPGSYRVRSGPHPDARVTLSEHNRGGPGIEINVRAGSTRSCSFSNY